MDIAHPQSLQTDPKIQNVRGYWAGSEDKGISQQTVIQNIFSKFLSKTTEVQKIHFAEETSFSPSFLSISGTILVYPGQQLADDLVETKLKFDKYFSKLLHGFFQVAKQIWFWYDQ